MLPTRASVVKPIRGTSVDPEVTIAEGMAQVSPWTHSDCTRASASESESRTDQSRREKVPYLRRWRKMPYSSFDQKKKLTGTMDLQKCMRVHEQKKRCICRYLQSNLYLSREKVCHNQYVLIPTLFDFTFLCKCSCRRTAVAPVVRSDRTRAARCADGQVLLQLREGAAEPRPAAVALEVLLDVVPVRLLRPPHPSAEGLLNLGAESRCRYSHTFP